MKYNFKEYKFSSHYFILSLIEKNKKVLDIGCASGYLALSLKEKGCLIDGIDIDSNVVEKAKKYCHASVLDISKDKISKKYDVIILGDVLEHLVDPWEVLISLKENLNQGGYLIISVPNITNIYARFKILFGFFDYQEKGLFDQGHLRFFSLRSFKKLIKNVDYSFLEIKYTPIPFYLRFSFLPKRFLRLFNFIFYLLAKFWPSLFAYQFVAKIKNA